MAEYAVGGSPYIGGDCGACDGNVTGGGIYSDWKQSSGMASVGVYILKVICLIVILILAAVDVSGQGNDQMRMAWGAFVFIYILLVVFEGVGEAFNANVEVSMKSP
jgi:hypothetical protein